MSSNMCTTLPEGSDNGTGPSFPRPGTNRHPPDDQGMGFGASFTFVPVASSDNRAKAARIVEA